MPLHTDHNEIVLIKAGELALKGLNRSSFEDILLKNLRHSLRGVGSFSLRKAQSTVYVQPQDAAFDMEEACDRIARVFGIAAYARACAVAKTPEAILAAATTYLASDLRDAATFKVEAKRSDKSFAWTSPVICEQVGDHILETFPHLRVDVHHPDVLVVVEVRDFGAYIHTRQQPGAGGMPVGSGGRAGLLISGGIDSPVAGYMMAKRGIALCGIHFASPPYTSERAEEKVRALLERVSRYAGRIPLHIVPFTAIQEAIRDHCPEDMMTLVMRRFMMRLATAVANDNDCGALVTGESVGQVASQTLPAIACTDEAAGLPVLRPVVGMDKEEIITIARRIDTFDISIQPYEDCCTVFTPRHPCTRPTLDKIRRAEAPLAIPALVGEALSQVRTIWI